MQFVVLYGRPAVGKLTVARELSALTGYAVFDNHLVVDVALANQDNLGLYLLSQRLDFLSRWCEFFSTVDKDPALQLLPATLKSNVR